MVRLVVRSIPYGGLIELFFHSNLCSIILQSITKDCGMYYTVCRIMYIKDPLLLIRKCNP